MKNFNNTKHAQFDSTMAWRTIKEVKEKMGLAL